MASTTDLKPVFAYGSDAPADLLANSVYVCTFLGEVAGQFADEAGGLSEEGAAGLSMVLGAVAETITQAMEIPQGAKCSIKPCKYR